MWCSPWRSRRSGRRWRPRRGGQVQGDYGKPAVSGFDLDIHAGKIVGIAGVDGNGQSELVETIVGLRRISAGTLTIGGQDLTSSPAWKRINAGLRYVPADRKRRSVVPDLFIADNSAIKSYRMAPCSRRGVLQPGAIRQFAARLAEEYDIRCKSINTQVGTLSGGNMQKLLAREVIERYGLHGSMTTAFAKGFRLRWGAIATSYSVPSNNIAMVGADKENMAFAVENLARMQSGFVVDNGKVLAEVSLRIGGIMSTEPYEHLLADVKKANDAARSLGCPLPHPFFTMAHAVLLSLPEVGLPDGAWWMLWPAGSWMSWRIEPTGIRQRFASSPNPLRRNGFGLLTKHHRIRVDLWK